MDWRSRRAPSQPPRIIPIMNEKMIRNRMTMIVSTACPPAMSILVSPYVYPYVLLEFPKTDRPYPGAQRPPRLLHLSSARLLDTLEIFRRQAYQDHLAAAVRGAVRKGRQRLGIGSFQEERPHPLRSPHPATSRCTSEIERIALLEADADLTFFREWIQGAAGKIAVSHPRYNRNRKGKE